MEHMFDSVRGGADGTFAGAASRAGARIEAYLRSRSERRPDLQLRPHALDHRVGELRRPGVAAQIGCLDAAGDRLEDGLVDCPRCTLGPGAVAIRGVPE